MEIQPTNKEIMNKVNDLSTGIQDILEVLNIFSTRVDEKFNQVDQRFDRLENRVSNIENRVGTIESTLNIQIVTKDYLDQKLSTFKAPVITLTNILCNKKIISRSDRQKVLATG